MQVGEEIRMKRGLTVWSDISRRYLAGNERLLLLRRKEGRRRREKRLQSEWIKSWHEWKCTGRVHSGPCGLSESKHSRYPNHSFHLEPSSQGRLAEKQITMSTNNRSQGGQGEKTYFEQQRELVLQDVATVSTTFLTPFAPNVY